MGMVTPEGFRVLASLRDRGLATVEELARRCLPCSSPDLLRRVLSDLEWFGYVVRYRDRAGRLRRVQLTAAGRRQVESIRNAV
jgi:DNA-binding MarR family transcriptional regulator